MEVVCQHCGGLLRAQDPSLVTAQATSPVDDALDRADRFLASSPLEFGIDTLTEPI
jgi:hypothetical protein